MKTFTHQSELERFIAHEILDIRWALDKLYRDSRSKGIDVSATGYWMEESKTWVSEIEVTDSSGARMFKFCDLACYSTGETTQTDSDKEARQKRVQKFFDAQIQKNPELLHGLDKAILNWALYGIPKKPPA